jgi:hypothetical protein
MQFFKVIERLRAGLERSSGTQFKSNKGIILDWLTNAVGPKEAPLMMRMMLGKNFIPFIQHAVGFLKHAETSRQVLFHYNKIVTGNWKALVAQWQNLMTVMGEDFLPVLTKFMMTVTGWFKKGIDFFSKNPPLKKLADWGAVGLTGAAGLTVASKLTSFLLSPLKMILGPVGKLASTLVGGLFTSAIASWGTIAGSIAAGGVLIAALAALTAILYQWYRLEYARDQKDKAHKSLLSTQNIAIGDMTKKLTILKKEIVKAEKQGNIQKLIKLEQEKIQLLNKRKLIELQHYEAEHHLTGAVHHLDLTIQKILKTEKHPLKYLKHLESGKGGDSSYIGAFLSPLIGSDAQSAEAIKYYIDKWLKNHPHNAGYNTTLHPMHQHFSTHTQSNSTTR